MIKTVEEAIITIRALENITIRHTGGLGNLKNVKTFLEQQEKEKQELKAELEKWKPKFKKNIHEDILPSVFYLDNFGNIEEDLFIGYELTPDYQGKFHLYVILENWGIALLASRCFTTREEAEKARVK